MVRETHLGDVDAPEVFVAVEVGDGVAGYVHVVV